MSKKSFQLSTIADLLGLELFGDDCLITGLNTLSEAGPSELSFLANPKYIPELASSQAAAFILDAKHSTSVKRGLISPNPYFDFARAASLFERAPASFSGQSELAFIDPSAKIEEGVTIYPFCFVGARAHIKSGTTLYPGAFVGDDCIIGHDCTLYPCATVYAGIELGNECQIQGGAVVGSDGYGFIRYSGQVLKIPQIGTVQLADGVDVGANTCIDRATLSATRIGKDTKIDNLVQIGHNVQVGEQCFLISQAGIAGSAQIGDRTTIAGQAGLAGHIKIGNDVTIGPQAGVSHDIPAHTRGSGHPFCESGLYMRLSILQPKVPQLFKRVRALEKELEDIRSLLPQPK